MADDPVGDLLSLAARRGLLEESAARRTLGAREPTAENLLRSGLLSASDVELVVTEYERELAHAGPSHPGAKCARCGRDFTREGNGRVCSPCGVRIVLETAPPPGPLPADVEQAAADPKNQYGRYVRLRLLGEGGFGSVWLAYDPDLRRHVALKVLHRLHPDDVARFRREALVAASLTHPGIAPVYEVGEAQDEPFLAMAFIDGRSADHLEPPPRLAAEIARDAARAVQHAHEQGVVHRDLKPSNLMVDRAGRVFVMDFGLAKRAAVDSSVTQSGIAIGTPAFMPPEQAEGQVDLDARADIYSLGATLYNLATGLPPFTGQPAQVLRQVISEEPIPSRRLKPAIPRDLEVIVQKAMMKDPARRYASASALADDLDRFLRREAIAARPSSWTYRLRKRVRRNPWAWAGMVAALMALVAGLAVAGAVALRADRARRAGDLASAAAAAYSLGNFEEAADLSTQALDVVPGHAEGRYWLGRVRLRRYQAGRGVPQTHIVSGLVELAPSEPETPAERDLRAQIEHDFEGQPGQALARGILLLWDGRTDEAIDRLKEILPTSPQAWEAEVYQAIAHYLRGDFEIARNLLVRHVEKDPALTGPIWVRVLLASGLHRELRGQSAADTYEMALAAADGIEGSEGAVLAAQVLTASGTYATRVGPSADLMFATAIEKYDQAIARLEGLPSEEAALARGDALLGRADLLAARGRVNPDDPREHLAAIAAYGSAAPPSALGDRAEAWRRLARLRHERGREAAEAWPRARADAEEALRLSPDFADAAIVAAEARFHLADRSDPLALIASRAAQVQDLTAALDRRGSYLPLRLARGEARRLLGEDREAFGQDPLPELAAGAADLTEAASLHPACAEVLSRRAQVLVQRANYLTTRGEDPSADYEAAAGDAARALEINPSYAEAFVTLGRARAGLGRSRELQGADPRELYAEAIDHFGRALAINPSHLDALTERASLHNTRALFLYARGQDPWADFEAAIADYTRALEINPAAGRALRNRASARQNQAHCRVGRGENPTEGYEAAIDDATRALEINPNDVETLDRRATARQNLALHRHSRGLDPVPAFEQALEDLTRAIDMNPLSARLYESRAGVRSNLAESLAGVGQDPTEILAASLGDLTRALEINPASLNAFVTRATARSNLALHLTRRGLDAEPEYLEAIGDYGRALQINPMSTQAYEGRGVVLGNLARHRGGRGIDPTADHEAALRDFKRAMEINPAYAEAAAHLGVELQNLAFHRQSRGQDPTQHFQAAIEAATRAIEVNPASAQAFCTRAAARQNMGFYRAGVGHDPREDFDAAVADFTRAMEINPVFAEAYRLRGVARQNLGTYGSRRGEDPRPRYEEALNDYGEALRINPRAAETWLSRCSARQEIAIYLAGAGEDSAGDYAAAIEDADQAIGANPSMVEAWLARAGARHNFGSHRFNCGEDPTSDYEAAIADCDRALEIDSMSVVSLWRRAQIRRSVGDLLRGRGAAALPVYDEAVADLSRALEVNPAHVDAWTARGIIGTTMANLQAAGSQDATPTYEVAIEDLTRALGLNPSHGEALRWRSLACFNRGMYRGGRGSDPSGDLDRAITDARSAIEINPTDVEAWTILGAVQAARAGLASGSREQLQGALNSLSRAVELNPGSAEARAIRGTILLSLGRPQEALQDFDEAIRLAPGIEPSLRAHRDQARRQIEAAAPVPEPR